VILRASRTVTRGQNLGPGPGKTCRYALTRYRYAADAGLIPR
jgi:hypothetical protein